MVVVVALHTQRGTCSVAATHVQGPAQFLGGLEVCNRDDVQLDDALEPSAGSRQDTGQLSPWHSRMFYFSFLSQDLQKAI